MQLLWTPRAHRARQIAIDSIAQDSPIAALGQLNQIIRQVELLAQYPEMGRIGRVAGTRELVISRTPFIVIYRLRPRLKRIEFIQFLHGAQQWPTIVEKISLYPAQPSASFE